MEDLISLILIIITIWLGLYLFIPGLHGVIYGNSSHSWPSVDGVITKSELLDRQEYTMAEINYRYWVRNKNYLGKDVGFCKFGTKLNTAKLLKDARNITYQYPLGKAVTVYHHPRWHRIAVLETGFRWASAWIMLFGLGVLTVGAVIAIE